MNFGFIRSDMSLEEQVRVWQKEYTTLYHQKERGMRLLHQCKHENAKMEETNQLSVELVENLKKQISKYRDSDQFGDSTSSTESDCAEIEDAMSWKERYFAEERASKYLRQEIDDLQNEMEELKEKKMEAAAVHEAWEEEVTSLFERMRENNVDTDHLFDAVRNGLSRIDINRMDVIGDGIDYRALYEQTVRSKMFLIEETSMEIQRLREVIKDQNTETFKNVLDRVARYHNLDGTDDTLFQLAIDVKNELNKKRTAINE